MRKDNFSDNFSDNFLDNNFNQVNFLWGIFENSGNIDDFLLYTQIYNNSNKFN